MILKDWLKANERRREWTFIYTDEHRQLIKFDDCLKWPLLLEADITSTEERETEYSTCGLDGNCGRSKTATAYIVRIDQAQADIARGYPLPKPSKRSRTAKAKPRRGTSSRKRFTM